MYPGGDLQISIYNLDFGDTVSYFYDIEIKCYSIEFPLCFLLF